MDTIKKEAIEKQLNKTIILISFIEVAILKWLNLHTYGGYILDILILTSIFLFFKKYDIKTLTISVIICIYTLLSYLLFGGTLKNTIANIRDIFPVLFIINFVIYLLSNYNIYEYFNKLFIPINIYMLLNVIVLILEQMGYIYLSGIKAFHDFTFTYTWDSVSGLFGIYGQSALAFYNSFVLLYNLIYIKHISNRKHKLILNIYNLLLLFFTLFISAISDNKIYFIFLLMFVFLFIVNSCIDKYEPKKIIIFSLIFIVFCAVTFFISYTYLDSFKGLINRILKAFIGGINTESMYTDGSGERFGLIVHYIKQLNLLFGNGLGNLRWAQSGGLGFKHFGISDLGTILCMGGFILLLLYFLLFNFLFKYIFENKFIRLLVFLITIVVLFCTQIIANISTMSIYILVLLTISWNNKITN